MGMASKGFGMPLKDLTMETKRVEEFEESLCEDCGWVNLVFLSQNSLWKLSQNRGYKGIYIVGWEGMWKVSFSQTGCSSDLTSRLGWVASSSCEQTAWPAWDFCPIVQQLAQLFSFWHAWHECNILAACKPRATREIQPRVPVSLHNLEQFFTLSHTLPLHDSHLNTRLLIAKIQANLARNKVNKMVDKIQPYSLAFHWTWIRVGN